MEPIHIAVRALFAYVFLLIMLRLKGKQAVAETTSFDFVLSLLLGDSIDDLLWSDVPASQFAVAIGTLVVTDVIVTMGAFRSEGFFALVNGKPRVLMTDGQPLLKELRKEQMNQKDLEHLLGKRGFEPEMHEEIMSAILELDGELSIMRQDWAEGTQKKDQKLLARSRKDSSDNSRPKIQS